MKKTKYKMFEKWIWKYYPKEYIREKPFYIRWFSWILHPFVKRDLKLSLELVKLYDDMRIQEIKEDLTSSNYRKKKGSQ